MSVPGRGDREKHAEHERRDDHRHQDQHLHEADRQADYQQEREQRNGEEFFHAFHLSQNQTVFREYVRWQLLSFFVAHQPESRSAFSHALRIMNLFMMLFGTVGHGGGTTRTIHMEASRTMDAASEGTVDQNRQTAPPAPPRSGLHRHPCRRRSVCRKSARSCISSCPPFQADRHRQPS